MIEGAPLFWHSVKPLLDSELVDDVVLVTDSESAWDYFVKNTHCSEPVWRGPTASYDDEPIIDVINFAYKANGIPYDYIVTIMANCPGHTREDVDRAISLCVRNELREVRSFNPNGEESGLMVFTEEAILYPCMSTYMGAITTNVKEIHYIEDLK